MKQSSSLKLISGTANPQLAKEVSEYLKVALTPVEIKRFSDGEIYVRILESVRGADVFIIQPTNADANQNLMELLIMVDALKRASPLSITAIIPYFGYARQDKKLKAREPITAKLVANMVQVAGVDRVVFFELHTPQVQGYFDIPSDNLDLLPLFAEHIVNKKLKDIVIVSPDAGGTTRARALAEILHAPLAIVDKRREKHNIAEVQNVIGDVKGKNCFVVDDMIDTAGSITEAAKILKKFGATKVFAVTTHAVFSGNAVQKLEDAPLEEVVVSNSIAISPLKKLRKMKVISLAKIIGEDIKRTHEGTSLGNFYDELYKALEKKLHSKRK
jgi:ribose-phosphate pyrophosphokinase